MIALFVHLLVLCLVFGLAYWLVTLVVGILPAPVAKAAQVILLVLLCLIAISILLGEAGFYDTSWSWRHARW
jgi:hypothetical protein